MALPNLQRDPIIYLRRVPEQGTRGLIVQMVAFWIPVDSAEAFPEPRRRSILWDTPGDARFAAMSAEEKGWFVAGMLEEVVANFGFGETATDAEIEAVVTQAYKDIVTAFRPQGRDFGKTVPDPTKAR